MLTKNINSQRSVESVIEYNKLSIDHLFKKYAKIGFIYPAKKEILKPFFLLIKTNWLKLYEGPDPDLMWIYSKKKNDFFASITAIKHGDHSMFAQHLVSNGNPLLSLEVMLAAQSKALRLNGPRVVKSCQNWFRPENRYPFRVFASFVKKAEPNQAALHRFSYLHQPLSNLREKFTQNVSIVNRIDESVVSFVKDYMGKAFVIAEELDSNDWTFSKIARQYEELGLIKSRQVVKITDENNRILGVAIANRAPLGLNFSFLENRAYYIINNELSYAEKKEVIQNLNLQLSSYYNDFPLQLIPIVTDESNKKSLLDLGATYIRDYMQSIWLKGAFKQWYNHIDAFLSRINRS